MVPSTVMYNKQFNKTTVTGLGTVKWSHRSISKKSI